MHSSRLQILKNRSFRKNILKICTIKYVYQSFYNTRNVDTHNIQDSILRPTMDATKVVIKNSLQNVAGSLKMKIPTRTVPTAPIPVHTG